MPKYKLEVATLDGQPIEQIPARGLGYADALNGFGYCVFSLPLRHPKCTRSLLEPGQRLVNVYRQKTRVWRGYLWSAIGRTDQPQMQFACRGVASRFAKRHIDALKTFVQQEQFDIAWDLIDFTQQKSGGDLGVTQAIVTDSGVLRDRTYFPWERKNLFTALQQLSAVRDGFDFEITPNGEWRVYYPRKGQRTAWTAALGKNVTAIDYAIDAWETATEITAIGEGEGDATRLSVAANAAALAQFGLLQESIALKDVRRQSTLDDHAAEELRLRQRAFENAPSVTLNEGDPPFGAITVGDEIRIRAAKGYIQIDDFRRVIQRLVTVNNQGVERTTLSWDQGGLAE